MMTTNQEATMMMTRQMMTTNQEATMMMTHKMCLPVPSCPLLMRLKGKVIQK